MLKKALQMSLQGVKDVVRPEKLAEITAEEAAVPESKERCILRYAQNAELLQRFRLCLKMTDPFIAASAFRHVGNSGMLVVA